jgi:Holliday junction resolvasome RuvABC endonuclease subunit
MARIRLEDIIEELSQDGWKVLSDTYKNLDTEMAFECSEGHSVYSTWKKIRRKRECPICEQNILKEQDTKIIPKKKGEKRILALDQATRKSGFSIYSNGKLLRFGTFETQLSDEIARDHQIKMWLISMINNWQPDIIGLEGIQFQQGKGMGVTTFATLARLQGILMETMYNMDVPYMICHVGTWRQHCGVKGKTRADKKKSMQMLVKKWFDVSVDDDCADAVGIGKYVADIYDDFSKIENWE